MWYSGVSIFDIILSQFKRHKTQTLSLILKKTYLCFTFKWFLLLMGIFYTPKSNLKYFGFIHILYEFVAGSCEYKCDVDMFSFGLHILYIMIKYI